MSSKASSTDPRKDYDEAADFASFLSTVLEVPLPAGLSRVVLPRIGSTNALGGRIAREYFRDGVEPPRSLIVAWEQNRGRGRRGRAWASPGGHGLYASFLLPVSGEDRLHTVPLLAAVGLCRAIQNHLPPGGKSCRLKWPNDLLLDHRKLGGVLIEAIQGDGDERALVIGFGINYQGSEEMHAAAGDWGAVALRDEAPSTPVAAELLGELVSSMVTELERRHDEAYARDTYQELSMHRVGDALRCRDGERTLAGEFRGFDERGFLLLQCEDGSEVRLAAGEVVA